jgi:hypothetical protein
MMKKQTAVEWLLSKLTLQLDTNRYEDVEGCDVSEIANQAKEMEREQIFKACDFGRAYGYNQATGYPNHIHNPEQYYTKTYSK